MPQIDITNWKRGQQHPTNPNKVLGSWRYNPDGTKWPSWVTHHSFACMNKHVNKPPKNQDNFIIRQENLETIADKPDPIIEVPLERKLQRYGRTIKDIIGIKKSLCKRKGIPFGLTVENMPPIPEHCPIFGVALLSSERQDDDSPSLDRIDPRIGYVPGNVIWISNLANKIKTNAHWKQIRAVSDFYEKLEADPYLIPKACHVTVPEIAPPPLPKKPTESPYTLGLAYKMYQDELEREVQLITSFENSYFWSEMQFYCKRYKEMFGFHTQKKQLISDIKSAFSKWINHQSGTVYLRPLDFQNQLSILGYPAIEKANIGIFGACIGEALSDSAFYAGSKIRNKSKYYYFNF